jgi:hypothetical protein
MQLREERELLQQQLVKQKHAFEAELEDVHGKMMQCEEALTTVRTGVAEEAQIIIDNLNQENMELRYQVQQLSSPSQRAVSVTDSSRRAVAPVGQVQTASLPMMQPVVMSGGGISPMRGTQVIAVRQGSYRAPSPQPQVHQIASPLQSPTPLRPVSPMQVVREVRLQQEHPCFSSGSAAATPQNRWLLASGGGVEGELAVPQAHSAELPVARANVYSAELPPTSNASQIGGIAFSDSDLLYGSVGCGGTQVLGSAAEAAFASSYTASPHQSVRIGVAPLPEDPSLLPEAGLFQLPTVVMPTSLSAEAGSPRTNGRPLPMSMVQADSYMQVSSARGSNSGSARFTVTGGGVVLPQQTVSPKNSYVAGVSPTTSMRVGDERGMLPMQATSSLSSSYQSLPGPVQGQGMQVRVPGRNSLGSPQQQPSQTQQLPHQLMVMHSQPQQQVSVQQQAQSLFDAMDRNHDGAISRNEFNAVLRPGRR